MKKKIVSVVMVMALGISLFGCGSDGKSDKAAAGDGQKSEASKDAAEDDTFNIVFIPKGVADFWSIVAGGVEKAAEDNGMEAKVIYPDEEISARQVDTMYDVINSKPDAIILAPLDMDPLAVVCEAAADEGISVILVDTLISSDDYVNAFMTDNKAAGAAAAEEMAKQLNKKGKIHIFGGSAAATSNIARIEGFTEYMEKNCPDIEILGSLYSDADMALATSQTIDVITANPDLAGIFAVDEVRSSGCGAALTQLGKEKDIILAGFDANEDTVQLMEQGVINFMTVQQPYQMGYMGFESALKACKGEEQAHEVVDTGCTVVTQENMQEEDMQSILFPLKYID